MSDLISRQAAMDALNDYFAHIGMLKRKGLNKSEKAIALDTVGAVASLPSEPRWIPVTARPMDTEERLEWSEKLGYDIEYNEALIYTSQLPDDGQEVLTCDRYGNVRIDTFENDPDYGCGFEENGDMDGIVAWMPLPSSYQGE